MENKKIYQYSQASLQDFADCKRRFYYRYYVQQSWPAVVSEPALEAEKLARTGEQFHHLVKQYLSGVPAKLLAELFILKDDLADWWDNFLNAYLVDRNAEVFPEKVLTGFVGSHRLAAKYDLILVNPDGKVDIFDWKTSRRQPPRSMLASRWQTIVYPFLLVKSGESVNKGDLVLPDNIRMTYWYPTHPEKPISFQYSETDFKADEQAIESLIEQIESRESIDDFPMTLDEKKCVYCVFRSLCDRGVKAGEGLVMEFDPADDAEIDFDQIQEIEF